MSEIITINKSPTEITVKGLKQICRDFGVKGYSRLRKAQLYDMLKEKGFILSVAEIFPAGVLFEIMKYLVGCDFRALSKVNHHYKATCTTYKSMLTMLACDHSDYCDMWTPRCCRCSDMRTDSNILNTPIYIDGKGNTKINRNALWVVRQLGYCPKCSNMPDQWSASYRRSMM